MPNRDGTGPRWARPGRGRGFRKGTCLSGGGNQYRLWGAVVPLAAAVIRSLVSPNGILGGIARKMLARKEYNGQRKAVEADYSVIDEDPKTNVKAKKAQTCPKSFPINP